MTDGNTALENDSFDAFTLRKVIEHLRANSEFIEKARADWAKDPRAPKINKKAPPLPEIIEKFEALAKPLESLTRMVSNEQLDCEATTQKTLMVYLNGKPSIEGVLNDPRAPNFIKTELKNGLTQFFDGYDDYGKINAELQIAGQIEALQAKYQAMLSGKRPKKGTANTTPDSMIEIPSPPPRTSRTLRI